MMSFYLFHSSQQINVLKFQVTQQNYRDVRWNAGNGPLLYRYTTRPEVNYFEPDYDVKDSGLNLTTHPNRFSLQWITFVFKCNVTFKCTVFNAGRSFSDDTKSINFKGMYFQNI